MKKTSFLFVLATLTFAGHAAQAKKYGAAGCGLGSMLIEDQGKVMQVLAATTNGTFGSQTFGISSGTSNCDGTAGGSASAAAFIETNRQTLAKDISRGQGETIANLSGLAGCQNSEHVGAVLQQNFSVIFPEASVSDAAVAESVLSILKSDAVLECASLS